MSLCKKNLTPSNDRLKRYQIIDFLGNRKFGSVYLVKNKEKADLYALKRIPVNPANDDLHEIQLEIEALNSFDNINIIKYYGYWTEEHSIKWLKKHHLSHKTEFESRQFSSSSEESGESNHTEKQLFYYLKVQFCDSGDLTKWLCSNLSKRRFNSVLQLYRQIINGVLYVHKNLWIHRDVKPDNILLHKGVIKIADFGLAVRQNKKLGAKDYHVGTMPYAAPEISNYMGGYDFRIDTYSIGIILFDMITCWNNKSQWSTAQHQLKKKKLPKSVKKEERLQHVVILIFLNRINSKVYGYGLLTNFFCVPSLKLCITSKTFLKVPSESKKGNILNKYLWT